MAANNDFFVKFDSNATQWANQLNSQLEPARKAVVGLQRALYGLENKAASSSQKVRSELARMAGGGGGGTGVGGGGTVDRTVLREAIHEQADALRGVTQELATAVAGLKAANAQIAATPGKLSGAVKGIKKSIDNAIKAAEGRGPQTVPGQRGFVKPGTQGAVAVGGSEQAVFAAVRAAVQRGLGSSAVGGTRPVPPPTGIASIRRSDIDKANFDRVVLAIRAQTRVLTTVSGAPTNTVTSARTPATPGAPTGGVTQAEQKAEAELGTRVDRVKSDIAEIQRDISQIIGLLGDDLDQAGKEMVNKLKATESQLKAQLAKIEREETGVSKSDQKTARVAAAEEARKARETVTDVERDRRASQSRLIASPGATDFDSRLGRARTQAGGNYSLEDLHKMAAAFREVGIEVRATTKTTKQELAARLKEAAGQYAQLYPTGAPQLNTKNLNVNRTTKIKPETEELLGDINELVATRERAREILRSNLRGGGDKNTPHRGRQAFGAGILGSEIGTPIVRGGTPAEVLAAYGAFGPQDQSRRVRDLATRRDFDPFDTKHKIDVGGEGEERQKGLAAVARLRDIRQGTKDLDAVAKRFYDLSLAISESKAFIARATDRSERGTSKDTDAANVASARERIAANTAALQDFDSDLKRLFNSSEFKAGHAQREGNAASLLDRQGNPIGSRSILEARAAAYGQREFTESDYRAIRGSTGTAVAGVRTAIGSRATISNIPDLGFNEKTGNFYSKEQKLSAQQQKELNQATGQLANAQVKYFKVVNDSTSTQEQVDQAFAKLENSANKFANQIERNFGGLAPSLETLMGSAVYGKEGVSANHGGPGLSEQTQADELRRQLAREAAEAQRTKKFKDTPEQAAVRARDALANAEAKLAKAEAERAKIAEALGRAEDNLGKNLTATQREHALGQQNQLVTQFRQANATAARAEDLRNQFQDVNAAGREERSVRSSRDKRGNSIDVVSAAVAGGLNVEGHRLGPDVTLNRAIEELTRHLQQLTNQQQELIRRGGQGGLVADDNDAVLRRVQSMLRTATGLRDQTGLGGSSLQKVYEHLDSQAKAKYQETAAFGQSSGLGNAAVNQLNKLVGEASAADNAIAKLNQEVEELRAAAAKAAGAIAESAAAETQKAVAETNGRLAQLKAKRDAIRGEGPYRRADRKAAFGAGDADLEAQIIDRRKRLAAINKQIDKLEGAGGGAGGGRGGRTASGASDGSGRGNLVAQILAELKATHATLKRGVPVSGATAAAADKLERSSTRKTRSNYATTAELVAASGGDEAAREAAMEAQRRRLDRLRPSEYNPKTGTGRAVDSAYEEQAKRLNAVAQAASKTDAELRDAALAEQTLSQTTRLLTRETQDEIEKLRLLTAASKDATTAEERRAQAQRIAAQRVTVAGLANRDLRNENLYAQDRKAGVKTVLNDAGPKLDSGELDNTLKAARNDPRFRRTGEGWGEDMGDGALDGFGRIFGGGKGFFQRILNTTGTFVVRNFAAGVVFGITNALTQVTDQAIQTEATFVRVSSAMEATGKEMGNIRSDLAGISTDYGVALNDVYNTASSLVGLFDNSKDLAGATRIAAQMQIISGGAVNATEAVGILAATMSAFQRLPGDDPLAKVLPEGVDGLQHVMDVLTAVQNQMGVNVETTAEGVSSVAGLAKQMSLSFEETAVFTAQIAKQTNQTGAAAGEQFSRILAASQTGRGRTALVDALGPKANAALAASDYGTLFKTLIANWDDLSESQQRNLSTALAGQRQQRAFQALMNNGAKTLNTLARAEDANGDAEDRMQKIMNTLNNRLARLATNAQNLASNLVRSGILNFLGAVLVAADTTIGVINDLLNLLNGAADENAFIGMLRKMITFLLGAGIAFKLLGVSVRGIRGAFASLPGRSQASEESVVNRAPRGASFSSFGQTATGAPRQAYLARAAGFGLDRTVGVAASASARGLGSLGTRLKDSERDFGRLNNRLRALGGFLERTGDRQAGGLRSGFQSFGSGQFGPSGYFARRAGVLTERASDMRLAAGYARNYATEAQAAGRPGFERHIAYADGLEKSATAAERAAGRNAKLSQSLAKVNETGALTDAAMIALAIGIAAVGGSLARHKRIAEDLQSGYDATYGKDAGKNAADQVDEYMGKIADDAAKEFESESKKGRWGKGMDAVGAAFTNGWKGFVDQNYANQREFGLASTPGGGTETQGLTEANNRLKLGMDELSGLAKIPGTTGEDIRTRFTKISGEIDKRAAEINSDKSLSDAQKQQALGNLQTVQKQLGDMAANLAATSDGLGASIRLSADQIKKLQEATQVAGSTGGITTFGGGAGAVDLTSTYQSLIADVGAGKGRISELLKKMFSGTATGADIAVDTSRLLQDEVGQLQNNLETKISENADQEEIDSIRSQLISTVSSLVQQQQATIDAIISTGSQMATLFANEGRDAQSSQVFGRAMNRAERYYQNQTKEQRQNIRNARRAQTAALKAARAVENNPLIGGILSPRQVANDLGAKNLRGRDAAHRQNMADQVSTAVEREISQQTRSLRIKQSKEKNPKVKAFYDQKIAEITLGILSQVNQGLAPPGLQDMSGIIDKYGNAAISQQQLDDQQIAANQAALSYTDAAQQAANTAAQNAFDLRSAQLGVASAYADARGNAVQSAKIQVKVAKAAIALARTQLADATTADETNAAKVAILNGQAQLIAANAAVDQAQTDLVQSRYEVSIALAEAAGKTVLAATRTLQAARAALKAALKKSGGTATAEVNAARVQAIQAEAALRDARLQDDLDTIDFNLNMGKITAASAIAALREILKTRDLTRDQRRQLLLQIKGMKDELADSQWNIGNIKLPTPYQMRAYIAARRDQFRNDLENAAVGRRGTTGAVAAGSAPVAGGGTSVTNYFQIDGADIGEVKRVIREVVGGSTSVRTRTTGARRR